MALSKEDKKDVKSKFGKALANKVARATMDKEARQRGKSAMEGTALSSLRKATKDEPQIRFRDIQETKEYKNKLKENTSKSKALAKKSEKKGKY